MLVNLSLWRAAWKFIVGRLLGLLFMYERLLARVWIQISVMIGQFASGLYYYIITTIIRT